MAETRKDEQDRLIDETLALFQNAIAETNIGSPPVQFGRAVDPKEVSFSEAPVETSVIGGAISFVRTTAGFGPKAVQIVSSLLQQPRPSKQAREKPLERPDPLIDQALSMIATVPSDEPNVVDASPPSLNQRQPVDKPASKAALLLERPTQEKMPSLGNQPNSLFKEVVISEHKTVSVNRIVVSEPKSVQSASPSLQSPNAKQASEEAVGDARSAPFVEQALSMIGTATIDKNVVEASPPSSLGMTEAAVPSSRNLVDQPASKDSSSLERPTEDATPPRIYHAQTEAALPLWQQRLDMDRADLRRRVALFKEHQQRFQREREEYYATTISEAQAARGITDRGSG